MMFGSNFDANFGIPQFPFQGTDPQGGLFGANFSGDAGGSPDTGGGLGNVAPSAAPAAPPAGAGQGPAPSSMLQTPLTSASPLSTGQAPPAAATPLTSPLPSSAGIGSPL